MAFQKSILQRRILGGSALAVVAGTILFSGNGSSVERDMRSLQANFDYDKSEIKNLPDWTDVISNVWDPHRTDEVPFFWYVPKTGGLTFHNIVEECLDLKIASTKGEATGTTLEVRGSFVNVDPGTTTGIDRAMTMGFASSGLADVYFSQHLTYSSKLFSTSNKGRMFVMLRHPVKRVIDQFYYMQRATWDGIDNYDLEMGAMGLFQYVNSNKMIENFVVRSMLGMTDEYELTKDHVDTAKEILRRKMFVGIMEWMDLSIHRFEKYFGWWESQNVWSDRAVNHCHYKNIEEGDHIGSIPRWTSSDVEYTIISVRNWADVELYMYAKQLFVEQSKLL